MAIREVSVFELLDEDGDPLFQVEVIDDELVVDGCPTGVMKSNFADFIEILTKFKEAA